MRGLRHRIIRTSLLLLGTTVVGVAMGDTFAVSESSRSSLSLPSQSETVADPAPEQQPVSQPVLMPVLQELTSPIASGDTVPKDGRGKIGAKDPKNFTTEVQYNPKTNDYLILKKIGDIVVDRQYMTFEEYQNYQM